MRIALFVHCFFPEHVHGTEVYTLDLARNLRSFGHEPVIVTAKFAGESPLPQPVTRTFFEGFRVFVVDKNHFPNRRVRDIYYQEAMREPLRRILEEIRPDIVHVTHLLNHTAALLEALDDLKIPSVATLTDFFGICHNFKLQAADGSLCQGPDKDASNCAACHLKEKGQWRTAGPLDRFLGGGPATVTAKALNTAVKAGLMGGVWKETFADFVQRADFLKNRYRRHHTVIVQTEFLKKMYESQGFTGPFHLIRSGVDIERGQKKRIPEGLPVKFGFLGQIQEHKGVHVAVEALRRLPRGTAELHLYGSSDSPAYLRRLRALAGDLPVFFHGNAGRDALPGIYAGLDFVILPSVWYENGPLVLLESLATGTPVIVSDVPGMSEFVRDGENGFLFARADADALYGVLQRIVSDPPRYRQMSSRASYPATSRDMTREILKVYESVLSDEAGSSRIAASAVDTAGV